MNNKKLQILGGNHHSWYFPDNKQVEEAAKRIAKEKELAKVSIKKEDVDLIVEEMEISKSKAERTLREHAGNVVEALASLTNWIKKVFPPFLCSRLIKKIRQACDCDWSYTGQVEGHVMESDDDREKEVRQSSVCTAKVHHIG